MLDRPLVVVTMDRPAALAAGRHVMAGAVLGEYRLTALSRHAQAGGRGEYLVSAFASLFVKR